MTTPPPKAPESLPRAGSGSALLTLISQASSSLVNLMLVVAVSRSGSASAVGVIAVVAITYQVTIGASRTGLGEVSLVEAAQMNAVRTAMVAGATFRVGSILAAVLLFISVLLDGFNFVPLAALGVFTVPLLIQDNLRMLCFAQRRPLRAAAGDVLWLAGFLGVTLLVEFERLSLSATGWTVAWCVTGSLAIFAMSPWEYGSSLVSGGWREWWNIAGPRVRFFLPEYAVGVGAIALAQLLVVLVASTESLGTMRLAMTFFGPVNVMGMAAINYLVPLIRRENEFRLRKEKEAGLVFTGVTLLWIGMGLAMPVATGVALFGETWLGVADWVAWLGLGFATKAASLGSVIGLRVRERADISVKALSLSAPIGILGPVLGFWAAGPAGFGLAYGLAGLVASVASWSGLLKLEKTPSAGSASK